jgi:hypothetical protein
MSEGRASRPIRTRQNLPEQRISESTLLDELLHVRGTLLDAEPHEADLDVDIQERRPTAARTRSIVNTTKGHRSR